MTHCGFYESFGYDAGVSLLSQVINFLIREFFIL